MEAYKNFTKDELIMALLAAIEANIQMQETIKELRAEVEELKARLNKNSSNSSKPPSSDGLAKPTVKSLREKSGKRPGGQAGHRGHGLKIEREADETIIVQPIECSECGADLSDEPMFHADTRYIYDAQIEIKLIRYDILEAVCPNCGATTVATPPKECKGTVNYGNMIRTLCVVLTAYGNMGIDKTHKILHDLLGVPVSSGTIKNIQREFATKTDDTITSIKENLLKSSILHVDETGMRVAGRTQWVHVASNTKYTLISVHKKRGKEGAEFGEVLPEYTGTLIHDCWKPYFGFNKCEHALCCAHLLRELNALIENEQFWALAMKELLLEMKNVVDRYKDNDKTELSRYYREKFADRYDAVLTFAKDEIKPSKVRKKSKAENLFNRLIEYRNEIIRFTVDFNVPFDNNQAERDVRNVKVKQKVSGCFRTNDGAIEYAKTSSVIATTVKFAQSIVGTVNGLFQGYSPTFVMATE